MQRFLFLVGLSALVMTGTAAADSLNIGLSDKLIATTYQMDYRNDVIAQASVLHAKADDHRSNVLGIGFLVGDSYNSGTVQPHIGAKLFALDGEHADGYGLALDGSVDFNVAPRVWLRAELAYAPDVVVGGDFDRYYELEASAGYQIIPKALVYLGYKDVQAKNSGNDYEVYQGIVVGVKFSF